MVLRWIVVPVTAALGYALSIGAAFGLAVGAAIDALPVRMTLIPAVPVLFGHRTWWFPAWLDRALPAADVEGEGLAAEFALAEWPEAGSRLAIAAEGVRPAPTTGAGTVHGCGALFPAGGSAAERSALLLSLGGRGIGVGALTWPVSLRHPGRNVSAGVTVRRRAAGVLGDGVPGGAPVGSGRRRERTDA